MRSRTASLLAWSVWAVTVVGVVTVQGLTRSGNTNPRGPLVVLVYMTFLLSFSTVGALVASRRPENPIGWLLLGSAVAYAIGGSIASAGSTHRSSPSDLARYLDMLGQPFFLGGVALGFLTLLLFPTGSLPSRRWRWVGWMIVGGWVLFALGQTFGPASLPDVHAANPLALRGSAGAVFRSLQGGVVLTIVGGLAAAASLIVRFRRAGGPERKQIEWLAYAAVIVLIGVVLSAIAESAPRPTAAATNLANAIGTAAIASIPIAIGIAILKRRLYDIDVVINKTVVFGALAAFITGVYVAVVVGIGSLVGERGGKPNLALSIVATAVVALGFGPVRERVQRLANRLVYGRRASPYEALSTFAARMGGAVAAERLLPTMARILAEGTGASEARVWLASGNALEAGAVWPTDASAPPAIRLVGSEVPEIPGAALALPVHHRGELLGALSLEKARGERLTPVESELAKDLASQAGLVLRNVRLTEELRSRIEDIRTSRARIVAAQDAERRRLERNIHDGAQQELVALAVKLRLAKGLLDRNPEHAQALLMEDEAAARAALETLRNLARGIYPPLLAEGGLRPALEDQASKAPLPVLVEADRIGRYPKEHEAAAYFCCLEALQNVAKYAQATRAVVALREADGALVFEVSDDGHGFDPSRTSRGTGVQGMADRLAALGGELTVTSTIGRGTTVTGRLPVMVREPEPVG